MGNGSEDAYRQRVLAAIAPFARIYPVLNGYVYPILSTVLLVLGTIGGILALGTLVSCKSMRSPSFNYHRALVSVNLVYCASNLLVKVVDTFMAESLGPGRPLLFEWFLTAFYSGVVSRVVSSSCGYMVLYVSLFVSLDRCVALCVPFRYKEFNQRRVSFSLIAIAAILSVCIHSWSAPFERRIHRHFNPRTNQSVCFWENTDHISDPPFNSTNEQVYQDMVYSKNIYNAVIRLSYPVLLTTLTLIACWKFRLQQENRASLRGPSGNRQSTNQKRLKSLFYLMISVVILAYIQVLPREGKRIVELLYPYSKITDSRVTDPEIKLRNLRINLYGHQLMRIVVNLCTVIDRSLTFYVYFCLNPSFRKATANLWCKPCISQLRKVTGVSMFEPLSTASGLSRSVSHVVTGKRASLSVSTKQSNGNQLHRGSVISYRGTSSRQGSQESFQVHLMGDNSRLEVPVLTPPTARTPLMDPPVSASPISSKVSFKVETKN